jgi:predicted RNA-binding protein associated with RNAse of E/G family
MDDIIACPYCTGNKWIISSDGVRCSFCNHWLTYDYDVYQILDKRLNQQKVATPTGREA